MTPLDPFTVHPIADEALGNTSYLIEAGGGLAVSIDPRRDVDEHLELAQHLGVRVTAVMETHLHADFVSGSQELAASTGAEIYAAAEARLAIAYRGLSAGDRVDIEDLSIEILPTPGHTPEHVAYNVSANDARALFSGGSLIVGGAARTDLTGAGRTDELARAQFASLRRLAALPDDTILFPTHGAGSFCSTGVARSATSTIGAERASNPLLAVTEERAFIEALLAGFGSYPRYFTHLRDVNRDGVPLLRSFAPLTELDGLQAHEAARRGAWLVDGRAVEDFGPAHAEGSVSIELRPAFASWLGWVVPFGQPVVLVLEPEHVAEATRLARRIGYDRLEGWVRFDSWRNADLPVASLELVTAAEAARRANNAWALLDVRQQNEYEQRHLPGAVHLELGDIIAGKTPDAAAVVAYCGHGERSATAASLLARSGIRVANLRAGTSGWRAEGYPFEP